MSSVANLPIQHASTHKSVNIFVSYSIEDEAMAQKVSDYLSNAAHVKFWNRSKEPGAEAWPTIFSWIDNADVVLAIVTGNTVKRAMSVAQEIGRAKAKNKLIIPLVGDGVAASDLGCLCGVTFETVNQETMGGALERIHTKIMKIGDAKVAEMLRLKAEKEKEKAVLFIGGAVLVAFLLSNS